MVLWRLLGATCIMGAQIAGCCGASSRPLCVTVFGKSRSNSEDLCRASFKRRVILGLQWNSSIANKLADARVENLFLS